MIVSSRVSTEGDGGRWEGDGRSESDSQTLHTSHDARDGPDVGKYPRGHDWVWEAPVRIEMHL